MWNLGKNNFSFSQRKPLDKSPHSFWLKNLLLLLQLLAGTLEKKQGLHHLLVHVKSQGLEDILSEASCVRAFSCCRMSLCPLLSVGVICLFLSRKLFGNKPSTSDLGEFLKIDLSQAWPPLTVGWKITRWRIACRIFGAGAEKQSDGKLHKFTRLVVSIGWTVWLQTLEFRLCSEQFQTSNFQIGAN